MEKTSSNGLPRSIYVQRNKLIIELSLDGLASSSILDRVNELAEVKGWEPISLRTVQQTIASYYRINQADPSNGYNEDKYMREAFLAQMELTMEMLKTYIDTRESGTTITDPFTGEEFHREGMRWQPFEEARTLKQLNDMQMDCAEIKGWNLGKKQAPKRKKRPFLPMIPQIN